MAEYISRQAAIEALRGYFDDQILWDDKGSFVAECCEETINNIPAADVRENVKGKWIYNQNAKHDAYWQCSICGNKWADSIYFNVGTTNFCPPCGAYMRGEKDDNT